MTIKPPDLKQERIAVCARSKAVPPWWPKCPYSLPILRHAWDDASTAILRAMRANFEALLKELIEAQVPARTDISPRGLCQEYRLSRNALHKRLHHKRCPKFEAERGKSGRLLWVVMNSQLHKWLSKPKHPGRRL